MVDHTPRRIIRTHAHYNGVFVTMGGHTHLTFSCCVLMMSVSLRPCTSSSNTHLVGHMARIQHSQAGTEGMQCAGRGKGNTYILMRGRNRSGWRATFSPATLAMALPLFYFLLK